MLKKNGSATYNISYYKDSNIKTVTENGRAVTYTYTDTGALASGDGATYYYDRYGNRSLMEKNGKVSRYSYDKNNRLIASFSETDAKSTHYTYDANGNMVQTLSYADAAQPGNDAQASIVVSTVAPTVFINTFTFDVLGRMSSTTVDGVATAYTYDGNGLRQSKNNKQFVYDGANIVWEGESLTTGTTYYRGLELIAYKPQNGTRAFYQTDWHGNVEGYQYDDFGNSTGGNASNPFRYNGEYQDLCSGLIYLRNRYYDSSIGRFITEDPARDGLNWYAYCENNPVNRIDPLGLDAIVITNENSVNLGVTSAGHTSAIYQNADGDWFYTYWGNKAAAVIRIPDTYVKERRRNGDITANSMDSLSDFNNALNRFLSANGFENITSNYTDATYIVGDFTASLAAAYDDVDTAYKNWFSKGTLTTLDDGSKVFQGHNSPYNVGYRNCFDRTYASLSKGTLADGTNVGDYMSSLGFKSGMVPNANIANFTSVFMNDSFTYSGAYSALSNYASLYAQNSPWAQKASKAAYANAVVGK